jgi:predicted dehydrogenase
MAAGVNMIRWGVIGAGDVTEVKSGPAFQKASGSELVAVMRRDHLKAEDYARRHDVPRWYTSAEMLVNDPGVNAVYVATPPSTHAQYAVMAMRAGKPVYVEKPMGACYAECLDMLRISEETGIPLFVAYYRRTLPAFLKVKELVEEGGIGRVLTVNIRLYKQATEKGQSREEMNWRVNPSIAGAGHFYDLASHQFDYLDFLFGEISEVYGLAVNRSGIYPAEDTVAAIFRFENGVTGSGSWCFTAGRAAETDVIEIIGEEGLISLPCFTHSEMTMTNRKGVHKFRFANPDNIQQNLIQQVVDTLLKKRTCISTGISAARTNRVLEEIVKDYYADRHN